MNEKTYEETRQESPVSLLLSRLKDALQENGQAQDELQNRLAPVLMPEVPEPCGTEAAEKARTASPLEHALDAAIDLVNMHNNHIAHLISRLQI